MTERLAQLEKLYEADPDDPFVPYGIALEHAKTGDHDAALHWLDRTLEIDVDYCYAWYQKGRILDEAGRPDEARAALQQGITQAKQTGTPDSLHAAEEMQALLETIG
ncbi:MAG: tetratricopeptide repeat protein [Phycisphaeraceae bacterium]